MPLAISFATRGPYEAELSSLKATCAEHGVSLYSEIIEPRGSWVRNCAMKPRFILRMMDKFSDQTLLWIDADARIMGPIDEALLGGLGDISCRVKVHPSNRTELLTGTILVAPSARDIIERWEIAQHDENSNIWDQKVLQDIMAKQPQPRMHYLDARLCAIFDERPPIAGALIVHTQASRRLKRIMGKTARAA